MEPCQTFKKESTQERERKRNKGLGLESRQANSPKKGWPPGGKGTTKNQTLLLSQEAYQPKKKGEVKNPIKTPSLEELSLAVTAHIEIAVACKCVKFALGKKGQPQRTYPQTAIQYLFFLSQRT